MSAEETKEWFLTDKKTVCIKLAKEIMRTKDDFDNLQNSFCGLHDQMSYLRVLLEKPECNRCKF